MTYKIYMNVSMYICICIYIYIIKAVKSPYQNFSIHKRKDISEYLDNCFFPYNNSYSYVATIAKIFID